MNIVLLALWPILSGPLDRAEEQFLRTAMRRNLTVRAESLDLASVREAGVGASSGLGPQLSLTGDAGTTLGSSDRSARQVQGEARATQWVPTGGTLAGTVNAGRTDLQVEDQDRTIDTAGAQVSFTQPLLRGFGAGSSVLHASRQGEYALKVKIQGSRSVVFARIQAARTAFWQQLARTQIVSARREDSVRTLRFLEASRLKRSAGSASDLDTLQAYAEHLQAVSSLLSAQNDQRSGWRDLLALSDTSGIELPVLDSGALPPVAEGAIPDSAVLLRSAEDQAPDLAQAVALVEKASEEKRFRANDRLPTLDVTALAGTDLLEGGWVLGAKAHLEWLLPGGTSRSRYRQALLDLHASEVRREAARSELARQIGRLVEAVASARAQQVVATQLAVAQSRRLAATEAGWKVGRLPWTDLVAARRDGLVAQADAWQALASAKALEAELEARTGTGPARLGWIGE